MSRPYWRAWHTTELQSSRTNDRCDVKCFPTAFPSEIQGLGWGNKTCGPRIVCKTNYITLRLRSGAMALATSRMHSPLALALSKSIGMILRKGNRRARARSLRCHRTSHTRRGRTGTDTSLFARDFNALGGQDKRS